jgi:hypothetical protein
VKLINTLVDQSEDCYSAALMVLVDNDRYVTSCENLTNAVADRDVLSNRAVTFANSGNMLQASTIRSRPYVAW